MTGWRIGWLVLAFELALALEGVSDAEASVPRQARGPF
jgi:aspartate/methionine/tyrosine aminotransferase